jgi:hypothetical protein
MQTEGLDEAGRKLMLEALAAEGALKKHAKEAPKYPTEAQERERIGFHDDVVRHKTAMDGMRVAVPLAFTLWALVAGLIWVASR